ncbi:UNVERIFIED_CONTAM: hypothetical protein PYX00_011729 [Menopon gallinae]|uniref:Uncharacterized protein n=1 Tax=Menopon gallinae TaxID=328185 RepID=A0AAW2H8B6_9NEOP
MVESDPRLALFIMDIRSKPRAFVESMVLKHRKDLARYRKNRGQKAYDFYYRHFFLAAYGFRVNERDFVHAAGSDELRIKRLGYLGASFVAPREHCTSMAEIMKEDLKKEGTNRHVLMFLGNVDPGHWNQRVLGSIKYAMNMEEDRARAHIVYHKLTGSLDGVSLIEKNERAFFSKLQIVIDKLREAHNEDDLAYLRNEREITHIATFFRRTDKYYVRTKCLQLFKVMVQHNISLDQNILRYPCNKELRCRTCEEWAGQPCKIFNPMEDEIMRKIEQSKTDGKDVDLVRLIKDSRGVTCETDDSPSEKKIAVKELGAMLSSADKGCISCTGNFAAYTNARNTIIILKGSGLFREIRLEKDVTSLRIYEEDELHLLVILSDSSSWLFQLDLDSLAESSCTELGRNVLQVEKNKGSIYLLTKQNQNFQVHRYSKAARHDKIPKFVAIDLTTTQSISKFVFFNSDLYFIGNQLLHTSKKEATRIPCKDLLVLDDFLVVMDAKKRKKILYLVNKDIHIVHEVMFNEEDIVALKGAKNMLAVSVGYRVYIYKVLKCKLKLVEILNFDDYVPSIDILVEDVVDVFVLTAKVALDMEEKKQFLDMRGKEPTKQMDEGKGKEVAAPACMEDVVEGVVGRLMHFYEEERKEREHREKRRMEMVLEKVSEQLNKNLKMILEAVLKKEMRPIIERLETEFVTQMERKLQSKIDSSFKNQENVFVGCAKKVLVQNIVPVIEAGFEEIKLQIFDDLKQREMAAVSELVDDLDLLKVQETKETKLFNLIQRNEIVKGVELVLDSNEEVFEMFLGSFEYRFFRCLEPNVIFELFRKALLFNMYNSNAKLEGFIDAVVMHMTEDPVFRKYFSIHAKEDLISMIPANNMLLVYSSHLSDASKAQRPECAVVLEEILRNFDAHALDTDKMYEFNELLDLTIRVIDKMGYRNQISEAYLVVQKNYLKKRLRAAELGAKR